MDQSRAYYEKDLMYAADGNIYPMTVHSQTRYGAGRMTAPHAHAAIEMIYVCSGTYEANLDGKLYRFGEGDLLIINAEEVHGIVALSEGENTYIVTRFLPDILYADRSTLLEAKYVRPFTLHTSEYQKVFTKAELEKTFIPSLILDMLREYRETDYCFDLAIRSSICRMFLWILRYWRDQGVDLGNTDSLTDRMRQQIQRVLEYVEAHYMESVTVEEMAQLCSMSYSYFSRLFKQTMRTGFTAYLNGIRIKHAEKLLIETDMTVTDIAMEVGFTTASYFIQQFRELKGIAPKQFRMTFRV